MSSTDSTASNADLQAGRVIATHGRNSEVLLDGDSKAVEVLHKNKRQRLLCNDQVLCRAEGKQWQVQSIKPRQNTFERVDARGKRQQIAANLDRLLIVVAPEPAPSDELIERYLVAAGVLGIKASVILNKTDREIDTALRRRLQHLELAGYTVLRTAALERQGLDELRAHINGETMLFIGQSGVGKSTLINALLGTQKQHTAAISILTGKGTHTTTTARAIPLPDPEGSWLVDSPGVWEYSLWRLKPDEVSRGFPEFNKVQDPCRFRNCSHTHEPGCAIIAAANRGEFPKQRWEIYCRIIDQILKYAPEDTPWR